MSEDYPSIVELNVGGVYYSVSVATLRKEPASLLGRIFTEKSSSVLLKDAKNRYFIDRDGVLFRYILDYLRNDENFVLPENFKEKERLKREALYYGLPGMADYVTGYHESSSSLSGKQRGYITVGYRGSFAFGRDGLADVKFRKISRILVCGRVNLCRDVFGETLNESRDPDHGISDRYSSRFYLKHSFIEQAFDNLLEQGFKMVGSCGSGTAGVSGAELKPGVDAEENRWNHYNEFAFVRD